MCTGMSTSVDSNEMLILVTKCVHWQVMGNALLGFISMEDPLLATGTKMILVTGLDK